MPHSMLSHTYSTLFNVLVIDDGMNEIFNEDGTVKEELHAVWERIANIGGDSPAAFIMNKIVNEMRASDWKESESYNRLNETHIFSALDYAQRSSLNSFTIDEYIGFGTVTREVQDSDYQLDVKKLYDNFSYDHNLVVLQDANPLLIIGLYYYANEQEDPETMWHLFNHEYIPISLEDYLKDWTKKDSVLDQVEWIYVEMGDGSINRAQHVPVGYELDGNHYFAWLLFDNETNIWTIQQID